MAPSRWMNESRWKSSWKTRRRSWSSRSKRVGEIDLEVGGGAGAGAAVVEPPDAAVGEDAPADAAVRHGVGGVQVAQYLAVRGFGAAGGVFAAVVQGQAEALALLDDEGVPVAVGGRGSLDGAGLGVGVGEQQVVGDVLVAVGALLGEVVGPAEQLEDGADQVLLGGGLVGGRGGGEGVVARAEAVAEGVERGGVVEGGAPFGGFAYALGEEVFGEEPALHLDASCSWWV